MLKKNNALEKKRNNANMGYIINQLMSSIPKADIGKQCSGKYIMAPSNIHDGRVH